MGFMINSQIHMGEKYYYKNQNGRNKLKSFVGWINLKYVNRFLYDWGVLALLFMI